MLVYGSVTWTLTASLEKKIDGTYTRMLLIVTNKSWRDHLTNEQLYGDIPKISESEVRWLLLEKQILSNERPDTLATTAW